MKSKYLLPLVISSVLAGCGAVGEATKEPEVGQFPAADQFTSQTGTWPSLDDLQKVRSGITRDQLYQLIGNPHFNEDLRATEWDYLFNFRNQKGAQTCQFKVLFDEDQIARNFYWKPQSCSSLLVHKVSVVPAEQVVDVVEPLDFTLDGDVGFAFDSAELTAEGRRAIQNIAYKLKQYEQIASVQVSGFTDRLGNPSYNLGLSQLRADAVRQALIQQGIAGQLIQSTGYGQQSPVKECGQTVRNQLISCLAPNRRVEISAHGVARK